MSKYFLKRFGGELIDLDEKQVEGINTLLLETGKFIKIGKKVINISSIEETAPSSMPDHSFTA